MKDSLVKKGANKTLNMGYNSSESSDDNMFGSIMKKDGWSKLSGDKKIGKEAWKAMGALSASQKDTYKTPLSR